MGNQLKILTLDNESLALESLNNAVRAAEPGALLKSFTRASEALAALEKDHYRPDVAFLDIEMPGMTGIELAGRIRKASPGTWLIFVTGYSQYALEAFNVHASGYLLKPVTKEDIREELNLIERRTPSGKEPEKILQVHCFGNFEVFSAGVPVVFTRKKAKELFAYLVHKRGAVCTTREMAAVLFEDMPYDLARQNYLQTLITSMTQSLRNVGAESAVIRTFGALAVNTACIDCDFYRFLSMDLAAVNSYTGEYMSQYEWGEFVLEYLNQQKHGHS
jgi:two-component SAPR family response regulator